MSDDNRLQKAHQLSQQASILIGRADADRATLDRGLTAYREAAALFDTASRNADESDRPTLKMLMNRNQRRVRDVERRIASLNAPSRRASSGSITPTTSPNPFAPIPISPSNSGARPTAQRAATSPASPIGLAAGGGGGLGTGLAVHATGARASVPPFAMRPVGVFDGPPTTAADPSRPPGPGPRFQPTSSMYSSSSSSEPPDESYLLPGAIPDTGDSFGRFWGMLENMMEEISFPKALTTAHALSPAKDAKNKDKDKDKKDKDKKSKRKSKEAPSPSESFYLIPPAKGEVKGKTMEELALENQSLRASLDALAVHSHQLEIANKELKERTEERDKMLQSMVTDVRQEARKARHQEVLRSQMLSGSVVPGEGAQATVLRKRVNELEEEVRSANKKLEESRGETVRLNAQLSKYKERWDKLKAKKEAKAEAARRASEGGG